MNFNHRKARDNKNVRISRRLPNVKDTETPKRTLFQMGNDFSNNLARMRRRETKRNLQRSAIRSPKNIPITQTLGIFLRFKSWLSGLNMFSNFDNKNLSNLRKDKKIKKNNISLDRLQSVVARSGQKVIRNFSGRRK